jgi:hypothetical protein
MGGIPWAGVLNGFENCRPSEFRYLGIGRLSEGWEEGLLRLWSNKARHIGGRNPRSEELATGPMGFFLERGFG